MLTDELYQEQSETEIRNGQTVNSPYLHPGGSKHLPRVVIVKDIILKM